MDPSAEIALNVGYSLPSVKLPQAFLQPQDLDPGLRLLPS